MFQLSEVTVLGISHWGIVLARGGRGSRLAVVRAAPLAQVTTTAAPRPSSLVLTLAGGVRVSLHTPHAHRIHLMIDKFRIEDRQVRFLIIHSPLDIHYNCFLMEAFRP